jgi:hypothetical protein
MVYIETQSLGKRGPTADGYGLVFVEFFILF